MKKSKKTGRRKSVPTPKKKEPMVIEVIFPNPVDTKYTKSTDNLTESADKSDEKRPPERIVFRF